MKNGYTHSDFHDPWRDVHGYVSENFIAALVGKSSRRSMTPAVLIGVPFYSDAVRITVLVATSAMMVPKR